MKTIDIDPNLLTPNPWNSNVMSPDNEAKLDASLSRLGLFKPVLCRELEDGSFEILGGEHRAQSAVRIGLKKIPIINLGRIDDTKAKEISLVDNARYGHDDTIALAKLLEELGDPEDLSSYLPYIESDIASIFASVDHALDALEIPDGFDEEDGAEPGPAAEKAPKTHTIMRFKVTLGDAESITELLTKVKKRQAFTSSDDLTNAGDALVHQLFAVAE